MFKLYQLFYRRISQLELTVNTVQTKMTAMYAGNEYTLRPIGTKNKKD